MSTNIQQVVSHLQQVSILTIRNIIFTIQFFLNNALKIAPSYIEDQMCCLLQSKPPRDPTSISSLSAEDRENSVESHKGPRLH